MKIKRAIIFLLELLIIIIPPMLQLFKSKWSALPENQGHRYLSEGQCDAVVKSMGPGVQLDSSGSHKPLEKSPTDPCPQCLSFLIWKK